MFISRIERCRICGNEFRLWYPDKISQQGKHVIQVCETCAKLELMKNIPQHIGDDRATHCAENIREAQAKSKGGKQE